MRLKIYQVDAFAVNVFSGNPAAVVPLENWLEDSILQSIAEENNLSETAFFTLKNGHYHLRWFTPKQEVSLCGHATLAAAFIIFTMLDTLSSSVKFETLSGVLEVKKSVHGYFDIVMPKHIPISCEAPVNLIDGLNHEPREVLLTKSVHNYYAIYNNAQEIRSIEPNLLLLESLHPYGVVVTAPGDEVDFVSRYFAPSYGIPEDPVTGSNHCALIPFWSKKLGKQKLVAHQISKRGGELRCEELQHQVLVSGRATLYLKGEIII